MKATIKMMEEMAKSFVVHFLFDKISLIFSFKYACLCDFKNEKYKSLWKLKRFQRSTAS